MNENITGNTATYNQMSLGSLGKKNLTAGQTLEVKNGLINIVVAVGGEAVISTTVYKGDGDSSFTLAEGAFHYAPIKSITVESGSVFAYGNDVSDSNITLS